MDHEYDRRLFLKAGATVLAASPGLAMAEENKKSERAESVQHPPSERVSIGIMGVNSRGRAIAKSLMDNGNVEISYICDVDRRVREKVGKLVTGENSHGPKLIGDFRVMLDDPAVDAVVVAAPNHWHAPATILACDAGKHVYVEKPCSYSPAEGEWAVAAVRRNKRTVQTGTQRRSWPAIIEAVDKVRSGAIGRLLYARTWYNNLRKSIGIGKQVASPDWLDWDLWQGPAPRRHFKDNVVHYNWHWHWHWGNGELGNNGVHALDIARWGMDLTYPTGVTAGGGKYRHNDDQETPDTMMVTYDFPGDKTVTWEGLSWSPMGPHDSRFGISFHGTDGTMVLRSSSYTQFDLQGKEVAQGDGDSGDRSHFDDFLAAIRSGDAPKADIEVGHQSALLCHLGNIAYRSESVLQIDPTNGHIIDNTEAQNLWSRDYQKGWEPRT